MTRRSWIAAMTAGTLAPAVSPLRADTCLYPVLAPAYLFPSFLRSAYQHPNSRPKLFSLPAYDDLPDAVISPAQTVRIPVDQMGRPENAPALNLLRAAYQRMEHDSGCTGFALQASLHNLYCFGGGAHDPTGGIFLAWHRALLYFHERLLRWHLEQAGISGAAQVALPYWDVLSFSESGGVYNTSPELEHLDCRTWISPGSATSTQAVGQLRLGLDAADLMDCGSYLFCWHMAVHLYVGGTMATLENAAFDPIFFALHASVDRMWTVSKSAPIAPASNTCTFYDPYAGNSGAWVRVDLKDFGATANLGISYAPPSGFGAWISTLAVPAAVEIQLPDKIDEGASLYVRVQNRDFDLGEIVTAYVHHPNHSHQPMPSRFAVSAELEHLLRNAKQADAQFSLSARNGQRIRLLGKWRLIEHR